MKCTFTDRLSEDSQKVHGQNSFGTLTDVARRSSRIQTFVDDMHGAETDKDVVLHMKLEAERKSYCNSCFLDPSRRPLGDLIQE